MAGKLTFESDLKGPLDYIKIKVMINADTKRWDFLSDFLHLPTTLFQLISNNKPPSLIETIQSELAKFGAIRQVNAYNINHLKSKLYQVPRQLLILALN